MKRKDWIILGILILCLITIIGLLFTKDNDKYNRIQTILSFIFGGGLTSFWVTKLVVPGIVTTAIDQYEEKENEFFLNVAEILDEANEKLKKGASTDSALETARVKIGQRFDSIYKKTNRPTLTSK